MRFSRIIPALGIAQIISWGSLYYSIAILASPIQVTLGISKMFAALIAHGATAGRAESELAIVAILGFLSFVVAVRAANELRDERDGRDGVTR